MNRKPVLRTETLTERRLKRQLRRFISLEAAAVRYAHEFCLIVGVFDAKRLTAIFVENKHIHFQTTCRVLNAGHFVARTPQERKLKEVYAQITEVANIYRHGFYNTDRDTSLSRLVNLSKKTLYQTRRDKEMTE